MSELIQLVTAELDQAKDTLILKSQNRRLSMMVNQLNLDLHVDVRHAPNGRLLFRTAPPGQAGTTVLKLGFTPALDTQVQETRKSVDLGTDNLQPLNTLPDIQDSEIQRLKTVGIHSVNDLHGATQTPAMLTEVSLKAGLIGSQPLELSAQVSLDVIDEIDESDDIPPLPSDKAIAEIYLHGALRIQEQLLDPSTEFQVTLNEPGTYRVSFTVDPDNVLMDQVPTNNRFTREFVVEPAAPPVPKFNPFPGQFTPKSGQVGDRITISGSDFD